MEEEKSVRGGSLRDFFTPDEIQRIVNTNRKQFVTSATDIISIGGLPSVAPGSTLQLSVR